MDSRFVLRKEPFGSTLFDKVKMRHKFLSEEESHMPLKINGDEVTEYEYLSADLADAPSHVLYSPIRVYYEMTLACNLGCKTCFNKSGKPLEDQLDLEDAIKALDGLRQDNVLDVRFTGGEPTQHPYWFELLSHARNLGFCVSLNTNGVYSDPDVFNKLALLDLHQITVSLDGFGENNDFIRGKGNFDKAVASLQQMRKRDLVTRINTIVTKKSVDDVERLLDVAKELVSEINFFYMRPVGRAKSLEEHMVNYNDLAEFAIKMDGLVENYPGLNILYNTTVCMNMNSIRDGQKYGLQIAGCPGGATRMVMTSEGNLHVCGYMPYVGEEPIGNLKDEGFSILNLWRNSLRLNAFREENTQQTKKCMSCSEYQQRCPGACLAMEKIEDYQNPYCVVGSMEIER